jgi:hypothetical protein
VLIVFAAGFLPMTIPTADDITVPDSKHHFPIIPLTRGQTVTQQFPANGGAITSVAILFGTYGRTNQGTLRFELRAQRDGAWVMLATETIAQASLHDNAYYRFDLSPSLTVSTGDLLQIAVRSDDAQTQAAAIFATADWQPPSGYLLAVSDAPQVGTAIFRVSYARRSGRVITLLGGIWQRATVMLTIRWQIVLALAFCGALAAILFFGRSLPDGEALEE